MSGSGPPLNLGEIQNAGKAPCPALPEGSGGTQGSQTALVMLSGKEKLVQDNFSKFLAALRAGRRG